jgi:adenylate cyclase
VSTAWQNELATWAAAYRHYLNQEWLEARQKLDELILISDQPRVYCVYQERIAELELAGVPDDWDGTFTHTSK